MQNIMKTFTKQMKATKNNTFKQKLQEKAVNWVKKYIKTDFSSLIFNDEYKATLVEPDDWIEVGFFMQIVNQYDIENSRMGSTVMLLICIVSKKSLGSFNDEDGVKINAKNNFWVTQVTSKKVYTSNYIDAWW